jgi:hypothetical protein
VFIEMGFDDAIVIDPETLTEGILRSYPTKVEEQFSTFSLTVNELRLPASHDAGDECQPIVKEVG